MTPTDWSPTSWQSLSAAQQPVYPDPAAAARVVEQLGRLPPLVTSWEIESLKSQLAEAAEGRRFLLQGGDCAESFDDCEPDAITSKLKILLQMSLVLVHGTQRRVIRVGRFAGQYAKPRSDETEWVNGAAITTYRGDLINRPGATAAERTPDPQLLLRGYERAAITLNFIRALIDGGFADLHHPEYWDLGFVRHSPRAAEYQRMVAEIGTSLRFMETLAGQTVAQMSRVEFYTSHEGLHLLYEQAHTRQVPRREGWYNLATHFPWIGVRTSLARDAGAGPSRGDLSGGLSGAGSRGGGGGAHVEYFRGIRNPIAVKVGPVLPVAGGGAAAPTTPEALRAHVTALVDVLHPVNEPGRLTIIHRFGAAKVAELLPVLIEAVQRTGKSVVWCCDPMHGNTQVSKQPGAGGSVPVKTRRFGDIVAEVEQAFDIHQGLGAPLGGVHIEVTGENVTECTGGARGLTDADLARAYRSHVDPRLNYEQALELAMLIARRAR
jgi:3-deoxy-7-phosphoheptulonate synthase